MRNQLDKQPMETYDDSERAGEPFVPEPFSVDIFSEKLRFSPPASVQFFQHLFRWSVYVFLPFFAFLVLAGLAVFLIIHPIKAPLDTTLAVNIAAVIFFPLWLFSIDSLCIFPYPLFWRFGVCFSGYWLTEFRHG